jgi:hypothetical protein
MMAAMVVSCGKKKLEGEQLETKYFTVTMPQGWEQYGASRPDLECMIHLEGTGKQPTISFMTEEYNPNMKAKTAAEMQASRIELNGYVDKGEMTFNEHTYYGYYDEQYEKLTLLADLADSAVLRVIITNTDLENEAVKEILDNVEIKAEGSMPAGMEDMFAAKEFDCDYYTLTTLDGWRQDGSGSNLNMKKDDLSIRCYCSTISFEQLQEQNEPKFESKSEMTVNGVTWLVYGNERSKLYNIIADLKSEPEKAMVVATFKVTPDDADLKKLIESIKLKK